MKRIDVQINHKLVGTCEAVIRSSSPLFKDIIDPWIEIEGFVPTSPSLTDDQQASINEAKKYYRKGIDLYDCSIDMLIFDDLSDKEWAEATVAFLMWALEQEEE